MARFVLNDEKKVNSYGFRVVNSGIDLNRFLNNPIMLNQHENNTGGVIGRWKNIQVINGNLTAESDFDTEDAEAKSLAGKVERGFIKGASMGISFKPDDLKPGRDGVYDLTRCILFEASICAIPSNENALSLFTQDGHRLTSNEISIQLAHFKKFTNMSLLSTLIELFKLPNTATENDVIDEAQALVNNSNEETEQKVEQMLNIAASDYNLDHEDRQFWKELALKDFDKVERMLLTPAKKRIYLSKMVKSGSSKEQNRSLWTLEDYRKNDPKALETDPSLFKRLYEQEIKNI